MHLEQSFTVPADLNRAWRVLQDLERVVPCLPGAELLAVEGDSYVGTLTVRLGSLGMRYQGKARIAELDEAGYTAVVEAAGTGTNGNGTARATIVATLRPTGAGTEVVVATDLTVAGKPAQVGRGEGNEVAEQLLGEFATCLADELNKPHEPMAAGADAAGVDGTVGSPPQPGSSPSFAPIDPSSPSIDLTPLAGARPARQAGMAAAVALVAFLGWLAGRRSRTK